MKLSLRLSASCLLLASLAGVVQAGDSVALTGRSPHLGPMTGTLTVTPKGDEAEITFSASFERGASWTLHGKARVVQGRLSCDLYTTIGAAGALEGKKPKRTHKLVVSRDGKRHWGKCTGKDGTTWFREALSVTADDPAPNTRVGSTKDRVRAALAILRRADANGDGLINGRRYKNELTETKDPLANALFDFVDYGNYTGQTSVFGPETRGDVQEGGLGLGYTTRPKHYTSQRQLDDEDLSRGLRELRRRLSGEGPDDLAQRDLEKILLAESKTRGQLSGDAVARYQAVHEAVERLLDHVVKKTGDKERATRDSTALLTHDELLKSLDPQSLESVVAKVVFEGGREQWMEFFKRGTQLTARDEQTEQRGLVGSVLQHYLLVIGKRARETSLLRKIQSHLPK
jgi:hypothetical protein